MRAPTVDVMVPRTFISGGWVRGHVRGFLLFVRHGQPVLAEVCTDVSSTAVHYKGGDRSTPDRTSVTINSITRRETAVRQINRTFVRVTSIAMEETAVRQVGHP